MRKAGLLCQNVTAEGIGDYIIVSVKNWAGRMGTEHSGLVIIFSRDNSSLFS